MKIIIAAVLAAVVLGLTLRLVPQREETEWVTTFWIDNKLSAVGHEDEKTCRDHVRCIEKTNQKNMEQYGRDAPIIRDAKCFKRKKI